MKKSRYFLVLFMISLLLLLPLFTPTVDDQLFPFQPKFITMNVKSPTVVIESNVQVDITLNLSYFIAENQVLQSVLNRTISQQTTLELPERGTYVFRFSSVVFAEITIDQVGLPLAYPIIVILLAMVNLGIFVYERYFLYFSY